MELPEAVHHTYPKSRALQSAGEQLCQLTVELCSSSKLSVLHAGATLWWSPLDLSYSKHPFLT